MSVGSVCLISGRGHQRARLTAHLYPAGVADWKAWRRWSGEERKSTGGRPAAVTYSICIFFFLLEYKTLTKVKIFSIITFL